MFLPIKVVFSSFVLAGFLFSPAPARAADDQPAKKLAKKGDGARINVGGRDYVLRFLREPVIGYVEASRKLCLWKDGTARVIDPLRPDLEDHFDCRWPIETVSADRSLAVVRLPDKKDGLAVAGVRKNAVIAEFPDPDNELLSNLRWIFSKKRQHVYCLDGVGIGGWYYLDLAQKKRVRLTIPGFKPARKGHIWNGTLLQGGKEVVLFFSGLIKPDGTRRLQFPLDEIEQRTVAVPEVGVVKVLHVEKDHLLASFEGWNYGIVSTQTWKVVKHFGWGGDIPGEIPAPLGHVMGAQRPLCLSHRLRPRLDHLRARDREPGDESSCAGGTAVPRQF
jgi:hypothetical protein